MVLNGRPVGEVAQSLGIGENLIYQWKKRSSRPSALTPSGTFGSTPMEDNQALYKRIRELETERDILKKALTIFSRQM